MDLMRIRERALSFQIGQLNDLEYLQEVVEFIVRNKKHLPTDISQLLHEAFGKQPSERLSSCSSREEALNRLRCVVLEDIQIPEYFQQVIPLYKDNGELFWTGEISSSTKRTFRNVLSTLYHSNKRRSSADSIRRALYCMALYRVIQSVMELHASKKFTTKIARFCANVILEDDGDTRDDPDDVAEELKADYKIGGVYESYAQKAGNGIIFYLFVLPSKLYEKCLNKTSDVDNVLGHYSSLGFQQEDSTTSAANSIVSFITKQFNSQVSIFKSSEADQKVKPTRKNGQKKRIQKTRTQKTSKRTGKNRQFHSPKPTFCQPSGQSAETTVDGSLHATNPNGTEFPSPMNSPRLYDGTNIGLSHSSTANVEASAHSFHEYESPITAVEPMNHAISGGSIVSLSNVSLDASQTQPLALSGMFNNAAHLMNEFQLEPMTYGANAAQLMHEFHLETFRPADYTNAAQLMQQFDMSSGYYGQQHL